MRKIMNATQHVASQDQIDQGVIDLPTQEKQKLQELLTFVSVPTSEEVEERAKKIAILVDGARDNETNHVMIGGAPYLMSALEYHLKALGIQPLYAFTKRVVSEDPSTGIKTSAFKHAGWVGV